MKALVIVVPFVDVDEEDVYGEWHPCTSEVSIAGDAVLLQVADLLDWMQRFYVVHDDGSGYCQRYKFVSATAL